MGFSTAFGAISNAGITHAAELLGDLSAPIAVVFAVGVLSLILFALKQFLPR